MTEERGIVFFLAAAGRRGQLHALHLRIAVLTMRDKSWHGRVRAFAADDEARETCAQIAADSRSGDFDWRSIPFDHANERAYSAKTQVREWSPFRQTIYADCDVTFHGDIEPLWPHADELVLTQFSTWQSRGRKIKGRIDSWKNEAPDLVAAAHKVERPGINTGVFAFSPETKLFGPWRELCLRAPKKFIGDESAIQVLIGTYEGWRWVDGRFNSSPLFGPHEDVRIRHYHGCKSFRRDSVAAEYREHLDRAIAIDFAGIAAAHARVFSAA